MPLGICVCVGIQGKSNACGSLRFDIAFLSSKIGYIVIPQRGNVKKICRAGAWQAWRADDLLRFARWPARLAEQCICLAKASETRSAGAASVKSGAFPFPNWIVLALARFSAATSRRAEMESAASAVTGAACAEFHAGGSRAGTAEPASKSRFIFCGMGTRRCLSTILKRENAGSRRLFPCV